MTIVAGSTASSARVKWRRLFSNRKVVLGMIHLAPLPGSPDASASMEEILHIACDDARVLAEGGVDGLIIENFMDAPFFPDQVGPETVAAMAIAGWEVHKQVSVPIGFNVLRNDWRSAVALAVATGGSFVRINVLTDALVTDQGLIHSAAAKLARYRRALDSEVLIFADLYAKHGVPLAARPIAVVARDMVGRSKADAIIVTGAESSEPPTRDQLREVRDAVPEVPIIIGSGDLTNTASRMDQADACIIGFRWPLFGPMAPIPVETVREFIHRIR